MTAFMPIAAQKAVEFVEAAGIADGRRFISDHAAAGLLKSYALMIETVQAAGDRAAVRGATVPTDLWQRIVEEDAADGVWMGGTVRLTADAPRVNITGIRFGEKQLQSIVAQHRGVSAPQTDTPRSKPSPKPEAKRVAPAKVIAPAAPTRERPLSNAVATEAEPMLVTVKQAMVMLGLGRTKVNEMMKSGRLVRQHIDGGVRIEVASIRALASGNR